MLKVIKKENKNENKDNRTPTYFKTVDDCAFFCATCGSSPIKIMKAMLTWENQQKSGEHALTDVAELACEKAQAMEDQHAITTITKVLSIICHGNKTIDKDEQFIWETEDLSKGEKFQHTRNRFARTFFSYTKSSQHNPKEICEGIVCKKILVPVGEESQ